MDIEAQQRASDLETAKLYMGANTKQELARLAGAQIGSQLGRGVASLFGFEDPRIVKARKVEKILQDVNMSLTPEDQANPANLYTKLAEAFAQDPDLQRESVMAQMQAQQAGLEYDVKQSTITKNLRESVKQQTTDTLAANAISVLNDPNASKEAKAKAQDIYDNVFAYKNLPEGFERDAAGNVRPIAGGPQDIKLKKEDAKKIKYLQGQKFHIEDMDAALKNAERLASPKTTGIVGWALSKIPGEPGYDLQTTIDTLVAGLGFDKLQELRDNSPTGGALGNVSNQELNSLQSAVASLRLSQSEGQFRKNLQIVKNRYARIKSAIDADLAKYQETAAAPTEPGAQAAPKFVPGKIYRDAQGNKAIYQADGTWKDI